MFFGTGERLGLVVTLGLGLFGCRKAVEPAAQTHGAELYARMCAVCHGAKGQGYAADNAPRLAQAEFQASVSDSYLREAIVNGRSGTTMSAWSKERGGPLAKGDVEELVAFVRTLRKGPRVTLDERPLTGEPTRGAQAYERECRECHGERGVTGPFLHIGNPELLRSASNGFLRYAIKNGRPGTQMPAFRSSLGDAGIEDLTAVLRLWASPPPPPPPPVPTAPIPLGPVPMNAKGPEPVGFKATPATTPLAVIHAQLARGARLGILDARAPSDYVTSHIAGAVSVPFYDPSPYLDKLPKDAWLVCYCACPHAESGQLAAKLQQAGFKKVTVLDEGLGAWSAQHYPTKAGDAP